MERNLGDASHLTGRPHVPGVAFLARRVATRKGNFPLANLLPSKGFSLFISKSVEFAAAQNRLVARPVGYRKLCQLLISVARQYAPLIDLVRCGAALSVALFHLGATWPHASRPLLDQLSYPGPQSGNDWFHAGFIGVEVFFVISGYVIAGSAVGRSARDFAIGRALRLLPLLWLSVAIGFVVFALVGLPIGDLVARAAGSALLLPGGPYLDDVVWTLVVEVMFYAAVGVLLVATGRRIAQALPVLALGLAVASLLNLSAELAGLKFGNLLPQLLLLRHGGFFALGILIWSVTTQGKRPGFAMVIALASCLLEIVQIMGVRNETAGTAYGFAAPALLWAAAVAVIWYGAAHPRDRAAHWVRTAGLMTYPIYLLHQTVAGSIAAQLAAAGVPIALAASLGMALLLALCWLLVEHAEPWVRPAFQRGLERLVPHRLAIPART